MESLSIADYNLEQINKVHDRLKPNEAILNVQLGCFSKDYGGLVMFVHPREHELINDVEIMENMQELSELTQYAHDNKTISTSHIYPNKCYDFLVAKNKKMKCGIGYPIILPVEELKKIKYLDIVFATDETDEITRVNYYVFYSIHVDIQMDAVNKYAFINLREMNAFNNYAETLSNNKAWPRESALVINTDYLKFDQNSKCGNRYISCTAQSYNDILNLNNLNEYDVINCSHKQYSGFSGYSRCCCIDYYQINDTIQIIGSNNIAYIDY